MTTARKSAAAPPWKRENPKPVSGGSGGHLSPAAKASAKRHAKAAGRPYPNLVDNMQAARKSKAGAARKRAAPRATKVG